MYNTDLQAQIDYVEKVLAKSAQVSTILRLAPKLELPNYYLGAGAVAQTVWNHLHGLPLDHGIKDGDLVYFDPDISVEAQEAYIQKGKALFADLPIDIDITNEARVHVWYKAAAGKEMRPYASTEDAINTWPTTASAVGVRYEGDKFVVYAPFGLNDMLGMIVRPNKTLITHKVYSDKVERWQKLWPKLTIAPWSD